MTLDELIDLRNQLREMLWEKLRLGDYNADAPAIRMCLTACLTLVDEAVDKASKIQ